MNQQAPLRADTLGDVDQRPDPADIAEDQTAQVEVRSFVGAQDRKQGFRDDCGIAYIDFAYEPQAVRIRSPLNDELPILEHRFSTSNQSKWIYHLVPNIRVAATTRSLDQRTWSEQVEVSEGGRQVGQRFHSKQDQHNQDDQRCKHSS